LALQNMPSGNIPVIGSRAMPGRATGGPVSPNEAYIVGEERAEYFVPDVPGQIYPSVAAGQQAIAAHNGHAAATAPAAPFGSVPMGAAVFNFYGSQYPTVEQMAQINMQYATALGGL
jgi:hypothetical protein